MRIRGWLLLLVCAGGSLAATQQTESPELFSEFMQKFSTTPEFREKVLHVTSSVPKVGEWLSPDLVENLRKAILGKDWQRVDHFPALTVGGLNHSVDLTMKVAGSSSKKVTAEQLIDIGTFDLNRVTRVNLDEPVSKPSYAEDPYNAVTILGTGVTMGDGPDPKLAPMHAQSKRLAEVLNRLALNEPGKPQLTVKLQGHVVSDAGALIKALQQTGHQVSVDDDLYFANFGHLHDHGRDVMMPFWIDSQIAVPVTFRSLLVPVSHSEHELHVRGSQVNADVSYYFGIDGKSEFRTMDSLNQPWVLGRQAFVYRGDRAAEAVNLLAEATRVYLAVHLAHPELPFGGYYKLGVCQDTNAAIEKKLQGRVVLFPLTHDPAYFPADPAKLGLEKRDAEFLQLFAEIPSDRGNAQPAVSRVLGALPVADTGKITIPGLGADLKRVEAARALGVVRRTHPLVTTALALLVGAGIVVLFVRLLRRFAKRFRT